MNATKRESTGAAGASSPLVTKALATAEEVRSVMSDLTSLVDELQDLLAQMKETERT